MTPWQRYQKEIGSGDFQSDPNQERAARVLQGIYDELVRLPEAREKGLFEKFKVWVHDEEAPIRGLYLWGGVGRGKTWLMDCFYDSLPFTGKRREHFHSFMQQIHGKLKRLKNVTDPLEIVAGDFRREARVICLDEFHVCDIADAMLLGRLLSALFSRGITLVTTSNTEPDKLYANGLQRERFLTAIEQIKRHTCTLELEGDTDFRLRVLEKAEIYHSPLDEAAEANLQECFDGLHPEHVRVGEPLHILGRAIETVRQAEDVVWFDFERLCNTPRATPDYIEIARRFNTVLLANVRIMGDLDNDQAQRFIQLIDEFYDRNVNLIISAAAAPPDLYQGKRLREPFKRTRSRLEEMQSREYLTRRHVA